MVGKLEGGRPMLVVGHPHAMTGYKGEGVVDLEARDDGEASNLGKWSHWFTTSSNAVGQSTCRSLVPHSNTGGPDEILPL
jgi:hypothetical protein